MKTPLLQLVPLFALALANTLFSQTPNLLLNAPGFNEKVIGNYPGRIIESAFNESGDQVAIIAQDGNAMYAWMGNRRQKTYDTIAASTLVVSETGNHCAYVAQNALRSFVVYDEVEGPHYNTDEVGWCSLSHDGTSLAYLLKEGDTRFIILNNEKLGPYADIAKTRPLFSPDGQHVAYAAAKGNDWFLFVDGKKQSDAFDEISSIRYSPDGKDIVCAAKIGQLWGISVNGHPPLLLFGAVTGFSFSEDSLHTAYLGIMGEETHVVHDDTVSKGFSNAAPPILSKNGEHVACPVEVDKKWHMYKDGAIEEPGFDSVTMPSISRDGTNLCYTGKLKGKCHLVINGRMSTPYDVISAPVGDMASLLLCSATIDAKSYIIANGIQGKPYDEIRAICVSQDGKHFAFAARTGEKWNLVLDGIESPDYDNVCFGSPHFLADGSLDALAVRDEVLYRVNAVVPSPAQSSK